MRDAKRRVIDNCGQIIQRLVNPFRNRKITKQRRLERYQASYEVGEFHGALLIISKPQYPAAHGFRGSLFVPTVTVMARRGFRLHLRFTFSLQLLRSVCAPENLSCGKKALERPALLCGTLGLAHCSAVPLQTEPCQSFADVLFKTRVRTFAVSILNTQQKLSAVFSSKQVVKQRRSEEHTSE